MSSVTGKACGKVILLGEHFVVHGVPAIAAAISNCCELTLEKAEKTAFIGPAGTSQERSKTAIEGILNAMGVKERYAITYGGNLPVFGGLGSSAAFSVAIVRAIAASRKLKLSPEDVCKFAHEGEKAFHGNPSGLDHTISAHGGVMMFRRGERTNEYEPIRLGISLDIVIGVTGVFGPTSKMVAKVGEYKKRQPVVFDKLCDSARAVVGEGVNALREGNIVRLGELMNLNHGLLCSVGVAIKENEDIVHAMRSAGALGAKITGGGGGGVCIGLARDENHAKEIVVAVKKAGFEAFATKIKNK